MLQNVIGGEYEREGGRKDAEWAVPVNLLIGSYICMVFNQGCAECGGHRSDIVNGVHSILQQTGQEEGRCIMDAVITPTLVKVGFSILSAIGGFIALKLNAFVANQKKKFAKSTEEKTAIDALETGVSETYHTLYKELKEKAADGNLSDADKQQLRNCAKNKAVEVAKEQGLELAKVYGPRVIEGLIEKIVAYRKRRR